MITKIVALKPTLFERNNLQGQFYGVLTDILAVPDTDSVLSSACQFFVEPIISVASLDTQYRCFLLATNE